MSVKIDYNLLQEVKDSLLNDDNKSTIETMEVNLLSLLKKWTLENIKDEEAATQEVNCFVQYINNYHRFLYSSVSKLIFEGEDKETDNLINNIKYLIDHLNKFKIDDEDNIRKMLIKLYDHINLAFLQFKSIKMNEDIFNQQIKHLENDTIASLSNTVKSVQEYQVNTEEKINNDLKEMNDNIYGQLLSIVGIFTALAFLVFGGINYVSNIFESVGKVPIIELMIVGSIWGICMMNMIFLFMYFIAKLVNKHISKYEDDLVNGIKYTVYQKYPLMFWSNWFVINIFIFSCWLKFIDHFNLGSFLFGSLEKGCVVWCGSATILIISLVSGCILFTAVKVNKD